jgi:site-specific DNA-methyltransferase (adenine-specific)
MRRRSTAAPASHREKNHKKSKHGKPRFQDVSSAGKVPAMTFRTEHLADGVTCILGDCREVLPTLDEARSIHGDAEVASRERRAAAADRAGGDRGKEGAMSVQVLHGDCIALLPTFPSASVDAVVTDPPYGLEFMGKEWDGVKGFASSMARAGMTKPGIGDRETPWPSFYGGLNPRCLSCGKSQRGGSPCHCDKPDFPNERLNRSVLFQSWCESWARKCLRVLKPGGHLVAFGGARTYHRLACAIEDAGFEIRDQIMWIYGSGFPKSLNVGNATTFHGPTQSGAPLDDGKWQGFGTALKPAHEAIVLARKPLIGTVAANVLAHGTGALNVDGCRVEIDAADNIHTKNPHTFGTIGEKGIYGAGKATMYEVPTGRWPANVIHDGSDEVVGAFPDSAPSSGRPRNNKASIGYGGSDVDFLTVGYEDAGGSAARFFYSPKADADDRLSSKHPTVKPVDLMAYLCRLVCPPGGTVLDPFAGSGSTGMACMREGFDAILIEREAEYVADIKRRIGHVSGADTPLFAFAQDAL